MFRDSPTLQRESERGQDIDGRTNNIRRKTFLGGVATFVGGGSASPLAFRTVKVVILDEVDKLKALPGEGDADALAAKRVSALSEPILRFSDSRNRQLRRDRESNGISSVGARRAISSLVLGVTNFKNSAGRCCASMT